MNHCLKVFESRYHAIVWCSKNATGECFVLTPGKVWHWIPARHERNEIYNQLDSSDDYKLVYRKSYAMRNLYS